MRNKTRNASGEKPLAHLLTRRRALGLGSVIALTAVTTPRSAWARGISVRPAGREVAFLNLHTGESLKVEYWRGGHYVADALGAVATALRDHRDGSIHPIDPALLDLLHLLHARLGSKAPFHVISGYRSPQTNALLHEVSAGVAQHSFHTQGKAIDIRLPGIRLGSLHRAALGIQGGGVGFYPADDFVHVDTGPIRRWG